MQSGCISSSHTRGVSFATQWIRVIKYLFLMFMYFVHFVVKVGKSYFDVILATNLWASSFQRLGHTVTTLSVILLPPLAPISLCHPRPTQPSIPSGSVNEYQLWLGRQRKVWFIQLADERTRGVQVKLWDPWDTYTAYIISQCTLLLSVGAD